MIFSTFNQLNIFFIFLFFGIIFGLIANIFFSINLINFSKNIKKTIINSVFYIIFTIFFVNFLIYFNFGMFSIILLFSYIFGYIWIRKSSKKLFAFLENKWYNIINTIVRQNKNEHRSKKS